MEIRSATSADAPAMAVVWCESALVAYAGIFPGWAPKPEPGVLGRIWMDVIEAGVPGRVVLVADLGGRIVGTVMAGPADGDVSVDGGDGRGGELARLYVHPEQWGRGIGRRLYDAALDHLRSAGFAAAALKVLEQNTKAREMYERWGWTPGGGPPITYPGLGVTEVVYRLELGTNGTPV